MLLRLWRTKFDPGRLDELNEFASSRSTPMFDSFAGCMGHMFCHSGDSYLTISMWIGRHAIEQAEASDVYRKTTEALLATGIVGGEQTVEVLDIDALNLGWESRREPDDEDYDE